jgi:hypothetical protein
VADKRERDRMVFETTNAVKRAIRVRAAMDGVRPADVVNRALAAYLGEEVAQAQERLREAGVEAGQGRKLAPRHKGERP